MKIKRLYRCKCTPKILGCGSKHNISIMGAKIPVREITLVLWKENLSGRKTAYIAESVVPTNKMRMQSTSQGILTRGISSTFCSSPPTPTPEVREGRAHPVNAWALA
jgi:hypothetical protein